MILLIYEMAVGTILYMNLLIYLTIFVSMVNKIMAMVTYSLFTESYVWG